MFKISDSQFGINLRLVISVWTLGLLGLGTVDDAELSFLVKLNTNKTGCSPVCSMLKVLIRPHLLHCYTVVNYHKAVSVASRFEIRPGV